METVYYEETPLAEYFASINEPVVVHAVMEKPRFFQLVREWFRESTFFQVRTKRRFSDKVQSLGDAWSNGVLTKTSLKQDRWDGWKWLALALLFTWYFWSNLLGFAGLFISALWLVKVG